MEQGFLVIPLLERQESEDEEQEPRHDEQLHQREEGPESQLKSEPEDERHQTGDREGSVGSERGRNHRSSRDPPRERASRKEELVEAGSGAPSIA